MNALRTLAAIVTLTVVDAALSAHTRWSQFRGITAETRTFNRLNRAATWADADPYLPDRYRDPRDVADTRNA